MFTAPPLMSVPVIETLLPMVTSEALKKIPSGLFTGSGAKVVFESVAATCPTV